MKINSLLFALFFFLLTACSKSPGNPEPGGGTGQEPGVQTEIAINQAIFLDPVKINSRQSDTKIMDSLIRYIEYTPKGADVHVNIFLFSYEPLIKAFKEAYARGVNIHMLMDNGREESEKENKQTILQFLSTFKSPSRLVTLKSDASSSSINHNKYALFSQVNLPNGLAKNVVFSTSHNFVAAGTKKIQDATVFTHKQLYAAFKDNWDEMAKRAKSGMKNFTYKVVNLDSIEVHFFPRRQNGVWDGADTYLEIFDKISDYSSANVRVVMSDWSRVEVAEKLTELQKKGVKVEVIAKDKSVDEVLAELERLRAAGGYVKIIKMSEKNVHSKITLVDAMWEGKRQKLVFTGSHNYTYNALRNNNEVLLMLKSTKLVNDYFNYFDRLKEIL